MGREERAGLNCPVQRRAAMLPELKYSRPSADPSSVLTDSLSIPHPRVLARHALPQLLESTLIPLAVFYVVLWTAGVWGALIGALVWSYAALIRRLATGREVPGLLILGVLGLTVRTVIAIATGSVFVYFLQPTIGLVVVSAAFLMSLTHGMPLAQRLAADFIPMSPEMIRRPAVRWFFLRVSLLWGLVFLGNAAATFWLLFSQPVATFLVAKTVVSLVMIGASIVASWFLFRRVMSRHGIAIEFG